MNNTTRKKRYAALWGVLLSALLCACGPFGGAYRKQLEQGRLQLERGQYEAAAASYSGAVERNARGADAYEGRGNAYAALADRAKAYSPEQNSYRRAALLDYKKACELDDSAQRKQTLINYYLRLGDEALRAVQDESAPTQAYGYEIANSYYQAALELNRLNGAAYGKIVALLLAQDKSDEASEFLEKGFAVTSDPALTRELEALRAQIAEREEQARRADALRILQSMPYYGNPDECRMSAAQAAACAKLLSDGINGKFYGFSGYGKPLYNKTVCWDEPYPVLGYGSYETDRAKVILADLAGNGVPYLCLFSTLVENNSFEIYGWVDGAMKLAAGEESWGGHQDGTLIEVLDGTVALVETVTTANNTHSGQTFRFREGGAIVTESWYEARENGQAVVRVTRDGAQLTYERGEWDNRPATVSPEERELPYTSFADVLLGACPLRDMVSALNAWAGIVSNGTVETGETPPEHSERHRVAAAMLHKLFVLDHLSLDTDTRLCYVRLVDFNGDGLDELLAAFSGAYQSESGTNCQFALYEWKDGALVEHPGGNRLNELRLARQKNSSNKGVLGIENRGTLTRYAYTFLNGAEEFQADNVKRIYEVIKNGQPAGIAESEFTVLQGQYETLERVVDFSQLSEDRNYERVVTTLYNMRG